jgi:hypothetical protein
VHRRISVLIFGVNIRAIFDKKLCHPFMTPAMCVCVYVCMYVCMSLIVSGMDSGYEHALIRICMDSSYHECGFLESVCMWLFSCEEAVCLRVWRVHEPPSDAMLML